MKGEVCKVNSKEATDFRIWATKTLITSDFDKLILESKKFE